MKEIRDFELCAQRLKSLADPDRLRLVLRLLDGPRNVSQLAEDLGDEIVKVSHHLGVLRNAGIVQTEKQGRFVVYQLHPELLVTPPNQPGGMPQIEFGCCRVDLSDQTTRKPPPPASA